MTFTPGAAPANEEASFEASSKEEETDAVFSHGAETTESAPQETAEKEEEEPEELSVEEQGRRIASQWTRDPEASGAVEQPAVGISQVSRFTHLSAFLCWTHPPDKEHDVHSRGH